MRKWVHVQLIKAHVLPHVQQYNAYCGNALITKTTIAKTTKMKTTTTRLDEHQLQNLNLHSQLTQSILRAL